MSEAEIEKRPDSDIGSMYTLENLPRDERELTSRRVTCISNGDSKTYTIRDNLGDGGFGIVYSVEDEKGEMYALKFIKFMNDDLVKALKREAAVLSEIKHPNIVQFCGFHPEATIEGIGGKPVPVLVSKYKPGSKSLDVSNLIAEQIYKYIVQMFNAAGEIHGYGILHKDFKPGNMITHGDELQVTDFGLAAKIDEHTDFALSGGYSVSLGPRNRIEGTREYLPKSQKELRDPDERTDLYSLGLVIYQMILGDVNAFPDALAIQRLERAGEAKGLDNVKSLAELVCNLTLEVRDERPASVEAVKETELFKEMEDKAGFPKYWNKILSKVKFDYPDLVFEDFEVFDENKRIDGVFGLIKKDLEKSTYCSARKRDKKSFNDFSTELYGLFIDQEPLINKGPKNAEDADLEIQIIRYCVEHNKFTEEITNLLECKNRMVRYKLEFDLNVDEDIDLIENALTLKRDELFEEIVKEIEEKPSSEFGHNYSTRNVLMRAKRYLSSEQIATVDRLVKERVNAREKECQANQTIEFLTVEEAEKKYYKFATSLGGKKVSQEFKDAYAMAAYKDGIEPEHINEWLASIEKVRHKNLVDKIKEGIIDFVLTIRHERYLKSTQQTFARQNAESLLDKYESLPGIDSIGLMDSMLKKIDKLGKKYNAFTSDLIEKAILNCAERTISERRRTPLLEETLSNLAWLGNKYKVNVESAVTQCLDCFYDENKKLDELKQKYPNAFKEAPKFEDLEKMVEGETTKKEQQITKTSENSKSDRFVPNILGGTFLSVGVVYGLCSLAKLVGIDIPTENVITYSVTGGIFGGLGTIIVYILNEITKESEPQKQPEQSEKIIPKEDIKEVLKNSASISTTGNITAYRQGETPDPDKEKVMNLLKKTAMFGPLFGESEDEKSSEIPEKPKQIENIVTQENKEIIEEPKPTQTLTNPEPVQTEPIQESNQETPEEDEEKEDYDEYDEPMTE